MCFGNPAKSLSIARSRMPAEQWARFEREFKVFCDIHGLPDKWAYWPTYDWAKWAFFQGRQSCWRDADREVPVDAAEPIDRKRGPLLRNPVSLKGSPDLPKLVFTIDGNEAPDQEAARQMFLARCASPADVRLADTHYERLALAMMDDEQAVASLERWKEGK
jgi:hypothetical protein